MILRRHGFAESWTLPLSLFDIQSDERTESACAFDFGDDRGHSGCALKPEFAEMLARLMAVAVIGLIGWGAIIASHIAASLYLRRFSLDSDDNLLARKHNTQVQVLSRTLDVVLVLLTLGAALMTFPAVLQYGLSLFASAGIAGIIAGLAARPVLSAADPALRRRHRRERVQHGGGNHLHLCRREAMGSAASDRAVDLLHRKAVPELDARHFGPDRQCDAFTWTTPPRWTSFVRNSRRSLSNRTSGTEGLPPWGSPISRKAPWSCAA